MSVVATLADGRHVVYILGNVGIVRYGDVCGLALERSFSRLAVVIGYI